MIHQSRQRHGRGNDHPQLGSPLIISAAIALWLVAAVLLRLTYWN